MKWLFNYDGNQFGAAAPMAASLGVSCASLGITNNTVLGFSFASLLLMVIIIMMIIIIIISIDRFCLTRRLVVVNDHKHSFV